VTRWETAIEPMLRRARWLVVVGVVGAWSPVAGATSAEDRAVADALFRDAKGLMNKKEYAEACRKLEESQRLDPRDGTLLNLAVCHEKEGKLATAWMEFQEALAAARAAKRWDRINLASRMVKELQDKVPHLTIEVSPGADTEGFALSRNGANIAAPAWGTPVPVDPGDHELEASAPGMVGWKSTVTLDVGEDKTVVVPVLEAIPPPPPEPEPEPEPEPVVVEEKGFSRRTTAYVVGGAGLLALGVGSFYGLRAISRSGESDDHCRGTLCDQKGLDLNDEASSAATISNVAIGLGLVGVGVGTYLLLTDPKDEAVPPKDDARVRWTPVAGPGQAAIVMSGRW